MTITFDTIEVPADAPGGKKLDNAKVTRVDDVEVLREVIVIADPESDLAIAPVIDTEPVGSEFGLVVRNIPSGVQPVTLSEMPLPTGGATQEKQDIGNATLAAIESALAALQVVVDTLTTPTDTQPVSGTVAVSSLPAITGAVTANAGTNLNTSALALESTLTAVKTAVEIIDNFISGSKGLVTEDNSAAILSAIGNLTTPTDTQPVSASNLDIRDLAFASDKVDATGSAVTVSSGTITTITNTVATKETQPATATLTNPPSSATTSTILAANAARRGATIFNESTAILYIKLGATASLTSYTVQIKPGGYFELPTPIYTGIIDGIWDAANGFARVTEIT